MDSNDLNKSGAPNDGTIETATIIDTNSVPTLQTQPIVTTAQSKPIEECLGSFTTYNNVDGSDISKNCQQLRTSARVFKKMKLDTAVAVTTSPVVEKEKKEIVVEIKTEVRKPYRPPSLWSIEDKDYFFEALNEYGKDFDAIHHYFNNKYKRKNLSEGQIKTKEQLRHFYHRTFQKISKHLKFSEDIKKIAQELYALINYGELRKKIGPISEKVCIKLNELIYRGSVALRIKGKTIRVKTPMCRALRKLNQLDEKLEDLKLPTRVLVELRPKNVESWLNVQFMSQNPRIKLTLTLQRRLSALLNCLNERWKTQLDRTHEKVHSFTNTNTECSNCSTNSPTLRFAPKIGQKVELPKINLTEYLTSQRICLNAYEERIGVKIPGERIWQEMCASFKGGGKGTAKKSVQKRQRNESTGEKAPTKLKETCEEVEENPSKVSDCIDTAINTILSLQYSDMDENDLIKIETKTEPDKSDQIDPKLREEKIKCIKNGWTLQNCGTVTIGELYLMFGHDAKLELEYCWDESNHLKSELGESISDPQTNINDSDNLDKLESDKTEKLDIEKNNTEKTENKNDLSSTLKKLLSLAKLHYRKERIKCPCGHICGGPPKTNSANRNKNLVNKTSQKIIENVPTIPPTNCMRNVTVKPEHMFRKPTIYPLNGLNTDSFRAQLDSLQMMRPKYTNRKGRPVRSKNLVVERMLPLLPKPLLNGHSLVTMKVISQTDNLDINSRSQLRNIAPKIDENSENFESTSEVQNREHFFTSIDIESENNIHNIEHDHAQNVSHMEAKIEAQNLEEQAEFMEQTDMLEDEMLEQNDHVIEQTEKRICSPSSISNFLDLDPDTTDLSKSLNSFAGFGLLSDDLPENSTPLSSPSRILKENDNQWLNSEVNDYSLTSLLGHLESPMKISTPAIIPIDETPITQDIDSNFPSLLGENGVDFVDQFVDMAAQVNPINEIV